MAVGGSGDKGQRVLANPCSRILPLHYDPRTQLLSCVCIHPAARVHNIIICILADYVIINAPTIINLHRARIIMTTYVLHPEGFPPGKRVDSARVRYLHDFRFSFTGNRVSVRRTLKVS